VKKHNLFFLIGFVFFLNITAIGQLSLSGTGPISEDFNSMGTSATASLPSGFRITTGTSYFSAVTTTTYTYGTNGWPMVTGNSPGGRINWANGFYGSATDRALGFLIESNYSSSASVMLELQNNTSETITQFFISWNYEKYRSGIQATNWIFYTGSTGSNWTQNSDGNFSYPADENYTSVFDPPLSVQKSVGVSGLSISPGSKFYLRWYCVASSIDHAQGLGIDDISISDFNTISAEHSQTVSGTGLINFNGEATGVSMNVGSISGSGNVSVQRHNSAPLNASSIPLPNISQYRWIITADAGITNINTQLRFYLSDIPNHGISEGASDIKLYKRPTPGSGAFSEFGTLTYNNMGDGQTNDYLSMDGITSFSEFVFASQTQPMPVELTSFTSKIIDSNVILNWSTATEINNYGFEIERAFVQTLHGASQSWQKIGFIPGAGNSNSPKEYTFTDLLNLNLALNLEILYRLRQIDNNGNFEYSKVLEISPNLRPSTFDLRQNYPNPFNPSTVISYQLPESGHLSLKLFDILGNEVAELVSGYHEAGYYEYKLSTENYNLSCGIYYYTLESGNYFATKKMLLMK